MERLCKSINLMLVFHKALFLALNFFNYINDLSDDVICNIAIYADDTTLFVSVIRHLIWATTRISLRHGILGQEMAC